jgi:hypothetical protein
MLKNSKCLIFDFETLSQNSCKGVVLCGAFLDFDMNEFMDNPYTFRSAFGKTKFISFDVSEQARNYKRVIDKETISWWEEQKKQKPPGTFDFILRPPKETIVSISQLLPFIKTHYSEKYDRIFTRGSFDGILLESIFRDCNQESPIPYWKMRDVRSFIEGLLITDTSGIKNNFIPPGLNESELILHDPRTNVVLDLLRLQAVIPLLFQDDGDMPY